ncbi:MAG: ATP-binding cassette domain-containing protein [Candidatus Aminicenantes bacterium]|nr:ATP-binding cassette domain-containing protein [Candidatus Aminicenantes bacterium]NIM81135.1 ATP-binding cassette domain-containing protein [Candidatus Aminicenantes bacterium]NIN20509.1 ATP-binding cassette domain-containing protein [Candidatus Aminicenantes bacterium]NIN44282.1 ATP-binding cassette domain-containing protein [Candidatus Aminicenantes bacterium]NIN87101.1 ATP-binding cassette domain-containing protein [Candidatus Aminicenantes bacterium]
MITVEKLCKRFKLTRKQKQEMGDSSSGDTIMAVADVSFTCQPGRVFTLLGPNGAGKTTTLRILATMLKPTSGTAKIAGFDTVKQPEKVRSKIGFLTGSTALYDRLTPSEIIKYYADLHGMDKAKFEERKKQLFDLLGIHQFANLRIAKLSSGMKQKVSIARTMIHDPEVVIFDEPTVGLDVITARNIIQLIRDCKKQGKTVIFSTHIMGEVSLLSDDLAIIHKGKLLFNDTFDNFLRKMESKSIEDEFIRIVGGEA